MKGQEFNTTVFEHIITPEASGVGQSLKEVWRQRPLLWVMARREMSIRFTRLSYRFVWMGFRPVLQLLIYLGVFLFVLKAQHPGIPYSLVIITGFLAWLPFIETMYAAGKVLETDRDLIQKSRLSRLAFPVYRTLLALPETGILFVVYLAFAAYLDFLPHASWNLLWLPLVVFAQLCLVLGLSLWLNAFLLLKPGWHHLIFVLLGYLMWVTPVFYMPDMVPAAVRPILAFNPLSSLLSLYRYLLLGAPLAWMDWLPGLILITLLLASGLKYFTRHQDLFAEKM